MLSITLFTTSGCHLCEDAEKLLLARKSSYKIERVDIALDDALVEQYGIRIPVVMRMDNKQELSWPFDQSTLNNFLS